MKTKLEKQILNKIDIKRLLALLFFTAVCFLIAPSPIAAAAAPAFRVHTSTRNAHQFITVDGNVWVATDGGVLVLSPKGAFIKKITTAQGLPDNSVLSLAAAPGGALAGTRAGPAFISRGMAVQKELAPPITDVVFAMTPLRNGIAYGTERSFCVWDNAFVVGSTETSPKGLDSYSWARSPVDCKDVNGRVTALLAMDDMVMVGTANGLLLFRNGTLESVALRDDVLANMVLSLAFWDNRLWAGTADGMFSLDVSGEKPRVIREYGAAGGLDDTFVYALWPDGDRLLIGTFNHGAFALSGDQIKPLPGAPQSVTAIFTQGPGAPPWIGTGDDGLRIIGPNGKARRIAVNEPPGNNITGVTAWKDKVCVGTFRNGAACLDRGGAWRALPRVPDARGDWINHIAAFGNKLYIRTSTGALFALEKNKWRQITTKDGLSKNWTSSVQESGGKLWAGTWGGVSASNGRRWTTLTPRPALKDQVITDAAYFNGDLFVATAKGGLAVRRKNNNKWSVLTPANGFRDTWVTALDVWNGALWAGTFSQGLARCDARGRCAWWTAKNGKLPSGRVLALAHDCRNFFAGTLQGLKRCNASGCVTYTTAHGLPHNTVMALAIAGRSLYVATPSGLAVMDVK